MTTVQYLLLFNIPGVANKTKNPRDMAELSPLSERTWQVATCICSETKRNLRGSWDNYLFYVLLLSDCAYSWSNSKGKTLYLWNEICKNHRVITKAAMAAVDIPTLFVATTIAVLLETAGNAHRAGEMRGSGISSWCLDLTQELRTDSPLMTIPPRLSCTCCLGQ